MHIAAIYNGVIYGVGPDIDSAREDAAAWMDLNGDPSEPPALPPLRFVEITSAEHSDILAHGWDHRRHGEIVHRSPVYLDNEDGTGGPCWT